MRYIDRFQSWPGMYSQAGQDAFVIEMTGEKQFGKYLEFGAGHPLDGNNTFLLEQHLQWQGISIDNGQGWNDLPNLWKQHRPNAKFFLVDAFQFDLNNLDPYYDYLQIDIDTPSNCLRLLEKVIDRSEFGLITFEHDVWTGTDESKFARTQSRNLLESRGYTLVVNDVTIKDYNDQRPLFYEDWYANPKFISDTKIAKYKWIDDSTKPKYWQDILKC